MFLQERCVYISVLDNSLSRSSQCVVMDSGPGPVCETLRSEEGQNSEFKKNPNTGQVSVSVRLNQLTKVRILSIQPINYLVYNS